jgi:bifunctional DNA-binding transcriptional regulator/antitoxin component of YhaV-PrlF toxin-antitoxin module
VTLPIDALTGAGLRTGDELRVEATGPGVVVLKRVGDPIDTYAGKLSGVYPRNAIDALRDEWD